MKSATSQHALIIGAGLCGSLLALRLAQRGYRVDLIEKRPDLRQTQLAAGRSINLAFSNRGAKAMRLVGLEEQVKALCIPMTGRMIHQANGHNFISPYSGLEHEYINSISRTDLNALLLSEAEKHERVNIQFEAPCTAVDLENASANFLDHTTGEPFHKSADVIFATDGAGSIVRKTMFLKHGFLFNLEQKFLGHGYKELHIPADSKGKHLLYKNALHIWPRGDNMIIALPNLDGSFTVTLFLAFKDGQDNFEQLNSKEKVQAYFEQHYPDVIKHMPSLTDNFFANPTGNLGMIKCSPWHFSGKTLLMGDAAHAIVPFYGQGMNASFEDVSILDEVLNENLENWDSIFTTYEQRRKPDTDAIGDLSLDNFIEMRSDTASPLFQQKRQLETAFEEMHPAEFSGKYRLVTFQENIGYAEALKRGRTQDKVILELLEKGKLPDELPLEQKLALVKTETDKALKTTPLKTTTS